MEIKTTIFSVLLVLCLVPGALAQDTCTTSTDDSGCLVTTCINENGTVTSEDIDCSNTASDQGQQDNSAVTQSSGDSETGQTETCKTYTDENGCTVETCYDETGAIESEKIDCPEEKEVTSEGELEEEIGDSEVISDEEFEAGESTLYARAVRACLARGGRVVTSTFTRDNRLIRRVACIRAPVRTQTTSAGSGGSSDETISEEEMPETDFNALERARRNCIDNGGRLVQEVFLQNGERIRHVKCIRIRPIVQQAVSAVREQVMDRADEIRQQLADCREKGGEPALVEEVDEYGRSVKKVVCKGVEEETEIAQVPSNINCRIVTDANGFTRRVCTGAVGQVVSTAATAVTRAAGNCPAIDDAKIEDCTNQGGRPVKALGRDGCVYVECKFEQETAECPSYEQIEEKIRSCEQIGMEGRVESDYRGCKYAVCVEPMRAQQGPVCPVIDGEEKRRIKEECIDQGGTPMARFDENGCELMPDCSFDQDCEPVPEEAFINCEKKGGKLVVKEDENGCPVFTECIRRADNQDSKPELVREVPDATKLLGAALRLEELRMSFEKLARKTSGIADYYEESGDEANADKFRRVSGMFTAGTERIDDLKLKIRDNARGMTLEQFQEIKERINFVKEILLQNIVYVMLSDPTEVAEPIECGTSGECFSRALMVCQPATFTPHFVNADVQIDIIGVDEDYACEFRATMADESGTYDMTCIMDDYAFGVVREEELSEICEGDMVSKLPGLEEASSDMTIEEIEAQLTEVA